MRKRLLKPLLLLALAACATKGVTELVRLDHGEAGLEVVLEGIRSEEGQLLLSVFDAAEGFPNDAGRAIRRERLEPSSPVTSIVLTGLAPGSYALAALHDENGNDVMETDFLGRPSEGWGASRDARGRFGPPSFEDSVIEYDGGRARLPLQIEY